MKVFYIDTSSSYLYAGIIQDDKLLIEQKTNYNKDLSKYALSEVDKMFKSIGLKPSEIDKIIVVSGPGSFTGIRIGMTIAKIYAWALKIEITTISSLDAMSSSIDSNKLIVPVIDARRGYVYAGIYSKDEILMENQYISLIKLKDTLTNLNKEYVYITNDEKLNLENKISYNPDILKIINKYKDKKSINPHLIEPSYFKDVEAEENLRNKKYDN